MQKEIGVSIVSYNTKDLLEKCIESVYRNTKSKVKVYVVDNASIDGSKEMVKKKFPKTVLFAEKENLGFGKAHNLTVGKGKEDVVVIANSDIVVLHKAIDELAGFLERNPEAGAVSAMLLNEDNSIQANCGVFPTPFREGIARIPVIGKIFYPYKLKYFKETKEVENFVGAFYAVKRKAFLDCQGFDEAFFLYGEESDLFYRMKKKGWKIFYNPKAKVVHFGGKSLKSESSKKFYYYLGALKFLEKHFGKKEAERVEGVAVASARLSGFFGIEKELCGKIIGKWKNG